MKTAGAVYALEGISPDVVLARNAPQSDPIWLWPRRGPARDMLLRQQREAVNPGATLGAIAGALLESLISVSRRLSPLALDGLMIEGVPTIPLIDLLPDLGPVIEAALAPFMAPNDIGLFKMLNEKSSRRYAAMAAKSRTKRSVSPSDYDGWPGGIVDASLTGTGLQYPFQAQVPFSISLEDHGEHTGIVAGSGWGKITSAKHRRRRP